MKNWTVRLRIQASFVVIIAIMLLMAISSYLRMVTIEKSADQVLKDAVPGMYFISKIRSAWTDHMLKTQELFGVHADHHAHEGQALSKADLDGLRDTAEQLDAMLVAYRKTLLDSSDAEAATTFEAARTAYLESHAQVMELLQKEQEDQAAELFQSTVLEKWQAGRQQLNSMIEHDKGTAERAAAKIVA